jgi:hypothetical protein
MQNLEREKAIVKCLTCSDFVYSETSLDGLRQLTVGKRNNDVPLDSRIELQYLTQHFSTRSLRLVVSDARHVNGTSMNAE